MTWKRFPYPRSFHLLNVHTNELDRIVTPDDADNTEAERDRINIVQDEKTFAKVNDDKQDRSEPVKSVDHSKKKSFGQKAAKAAKTLTRVYDADKMLILIAISSFSYKLKEVSSTKTTAAQYRFDEN